ncbi:complement factor B-like [Mantella aurantiaca]
MMLPLLLMGNFALSIAVPTYQCNLSTVAIVGGNYTVSEDGDKVEYSCPKGKYPFPFAIRKCQKSGQWSNEKQRAVCKAVECPNPEKFESGEFAPRQAKYFVGDTLHFDCWGGFKLFGPKNRTCQWNGKWSGETSICDDQAGSCPNPGIPIGATKVGSSYRDEDKVIYRCENGLNMLGSKIRECKKDKTWSGTEPSCRSFYTYDTPEEVAIDFASSLAETIGSLDPDRVEEKTTRRLQVKTGSPMNIFIVLDASGSIGRKNYNTAKEVAQTFIEKVSTFDFTPRYSVISYASEKKTLVSLSESEINTDAEKVIEEIQKFRYEGKHNMGGHPVVEVKRIKELLDIRNDHREDKLDIYAFGLGNDIDLEELNDIASKKNNEKHVFVMENIDSMKRAFEDILDESEAFDMCGISKDYSEDEKEKFPWIARITITRPDAVENCKGSIVTKNFILTAAHCFHLDDQLHTISVEAGGNRMNPKNLYRHPKYDPTGKRDLNIRKSFDYDLALIELPQKLDFSSTARPICLPCTRGTSLALKQRDKTVTCKNHEETLLTGELLKALFITEERRNEYKQMDVTIKQGNQRHGCLQDVKKVADFKDVADIKDVVTDNFLCTGGIDPTVDPQTCKGDIGGPLIVQYNKRSIQVGVISWGTVLSCQGYRRKIPVPADSRDFHARVLQEMQWIEEVIKDELVYLQ